MFLDELILYRIVTLNDLEWPWLLIYDFFSL